MTTPRSILHAVATATYVHGLANCRAAQDERGEDIRFSPLGRAVSAAAEDQLDEYLVDVWCQEPDELVPGRRMPVAEQHMRDFIQSDVSGRGRG